MKSPILHALADNGPLSHAAPTGVKFHPGALHRVAPTLPPRRVFSGNRQLLRALRAAEMAMWNATGGDFFRSPVAN